MGNEQIICPKAAAKPTAHSVKLTEKSLVVARCHAWNGESWHIVVVFVCILVVVLMWTKTKWTITTEQIEMLFEPFVIGFGFANFFSLRAPCSLVVQSHVTHVT